MTHIPGREEAWHARFKIVGRAFQRPLVAAALLHFYRGAALDLVRQLKAEEGKDIWLCGGATLAASVFPEIDELILKINPVVIGSGIPLFGGAVNARATILTEYKVYANGFVFARYDLPVQKRE